MTTTKPTSILLVATISGLLQGTIAALVVPSFAFFSLLAGAAPTQLQSAMAASDNGMILALAAPFIFGTIGFVGGGFMAFMFNLLVTTKTKRMVVLQESVPAPSVVLSEAA